ncbi:hypothetical protein LJC56_06785 [Christensenellaceae bacterium OttesenSCG-928-K19]|nr:hypothetical protein [Christensenellaceae bacterium OttesenSCG-928-K19]
MANQALAYIKETEEDSKKLTEQALADAAKMVDDANKKAEADISAAEEQLRTDLKNAQEAATQKAAAGQKDFEAETERMCGELEQSLSGRKGEAVQAVIDTIANK